MGHRRLRRPGLAVVHEIETDIQQHRGAGPPAMLEGKVAHEADAPRRRQLGGVPRPPERPLRPRQQLLGRQLGLEQRLGFGRVGGFRSGWIEYVSGITV